MALLPKRPRISSTASWTFSIVMRCWTLSNSVSCSALSLGESSMARTVTALTFVFQEYRSLKLRNAAAAISEGSCVLIGSLHWNCEPKRSFPRTWTRTVDCYQTEFMNANLKAVCFLHAFYPAACVSTHTVVLCDMNGRQMPLSPAPTSSSVPLGLIRRGYVSHRYIGPSVTS